MADARYWISKLGLVPHGEGGWYSETYRSSDRLPLVSLPVGYTGSRPCSTAIYFLLTGSAPSRFHRLRSDEVWHFYDGTGLTLHLLHADGKYTCAAVGRRPERGEQFQVTVPRGIWMAGEVQEPGGFALVGCTVAPGFEQDDFELGARADLLAKYPDYHEIIARLTLPG